MSELTTDSDLNEAQAAVKAAKRADQLVERIARIQFRQARDEELEITKNNEAYAEELRLRTAELEFLAAKYGAD